MCVCVMARYTLTTRNILLYVIIPGPNGKSFTIPSTDVYILNFNVTCSDDRETIRDSAQGPFPVNAPGPCPNNAEIVNLRSM